jgi:hypothetical protein
MNDGVENGLVWKVQTHPEHRKKRHGADGDPSYFHVLIHGSNMLVGAVRDFLENCLCVSAVVLDKVSL